MAVKQLPAVNYKIMNFFTWLLIIGLVLFLVGLPFHLVIKKLVPGTVGTYWKELLLGVLILIWGILSLLNRRLLLTGTALDAATLAFLGYIILRLALTGFSLQAMWGFYYSVMYLPIFWLIFVALQRYPGWLEKLVGLVVLLGAIVAVGGILEFILDRSLWPSAEILQRQGFPDVYIYGTHLRRVYFVFDSPTTLANTLALIFPLSFGMIFASQQNAGKLFYGIATLVMIACIGFTFSRGIWVASVVGLLVMGFLAGFFQRNKGLIIGLIGIAVLGLVVWVGITMVRAARLPSSSYTSLELTTDELRKAPLLDVTEDLLIQTPAYGATTLQNWTIFDPIQNQNDPRVILYEPAAKTGETEIIYRVAVPELGALRFAIALAPDVWSPEKGDGVNFQVKIASVDAPQDKQILLDRYINPKINPSDRRWRSYLIDLSPWSGNDVNISLITNNGPAQNWDYDWAGWADLSVIRISPGYFASQQPTSNSIVIQYIKSISNWVSDQTNLDRLAAWNLSLDAWRSAPIWGTGLGSTGLAGFRTNPTTAFVTESQVLKTLTELGIPGIILFAFLWYTIARVGIRTLRKPLNAKSKMILYGLLTSMVIIFIEGWVYQNLEAKQVNALFWTLTGMLAFLSLNRHD